MIKEANAITGGGIGGNTYGRSAGTGQQSQQTQPQQAQGSNTTPTKQPTTYKRLNLKTIDQNKNRQYATYDFSKQDQTLTPDKINSSEYVHNITNGILAGRNIHPSHLNELAGVLEANPEVAKELKGKGLTADMIRNSYLKQGVMGSQNTIDQNLDSRYKNILR